MTDTVDVKLLKEALIKATKARWKAEDEVLRLRTRVAELQAARMMSAQSGGVDRAPIARAEEATLVSGASGTPNAIGGRKRTASSVPQAY